MKIVLRSLVSALLAVSCVSAQVHDPTLNWRAATSQELVTVIPARAQVIHERIETEGYSNTGITDGHAHFVAATVLITAGYAAHGKYSHLLVTQVPLRLDGHLDVAPGSYVLGWDRGTETLQVHVYRAESGEQVGTVEAHSTATRITVVSIRIWPPRERQVLQIGTVSNPLSAPLGFRFYEGTCTHPGRLGE